MIDWIIENKDWFFSGIGVFLLGGIIVVIKWYTKQRKPIEKTISPMPEPDAVPIEKTISPMPEPDAVPMSPTGKTLSGLTPDQIIEQIRELPPYQQDEARRHYVGIRVRWKGELLSAEPHKGKKISVTLSYMAMGSMIMFTVSEEDYPEFKVMSKHTDVVVEGRITYVSDLGMIILEDVIISY